MHTGPAEIEKMFWPDDERDDWNDEPEERKFQLYSPCKCAKSHAKKYQDGIAEGYEIVCMDGSFHVHEYCLYNSEFLYNMLQGSDTVAIDIFVQWYFLTRSYQ